MRWRALPISCVGVASLTLCYTAWVYPGLPAWIPVHWDAANRATGFAPKAYAAAVGPLMTGLLCCLLFVAPRLRHTPMPPQELAGFEWVLTAVITLIASIHWAILAVARGQPVDLGAAIQIGLLGTAATVVYAAYRSTREL